MPNVSDEGHISYRGLKFYFETLTLLFGSACLEGIDALGRAA